MRHSLASPTDRARSLVLVAAIHGVIGYGLLTGLGVMPAPPLPQEALALIDIVPEPEPPATPMLPEAAPKKTERPKDPEGAAAPPALKNTPTPVVAPPPQVKLPPPEPIPASPLPGTGSAANPGAAPVPGPGTGRGGEGEGLGSGRFGDGTGGGGGGGFGAPVRFRSGSIEWRDVPDRVLAQQPRGTVRFRMLVGRDGRVRDCRVTGSSGYPGLDSATCAAAIRRLRWHPARDTAGRPIEAWVPGSNEWIPRPGADRWQEVEEIRD
jgi:protein TonB